MTLQEAIQIARQRQAAGDLAAAESIYRQVLAQQPGLAEIGSNLGIVLFQQGRLAESAVALKDAGMLAPENGEIHNNLAAVLLRLGELDAAEAAGRRAIEWRPDFAAAFGNLAAILQTGGRVEEAVACYERAMKLNPRNPAAGSGWIMARQLLGDSDGQGLLADVRLWNERFAAPLQNPAAAHAVDHGADRRMRIGYVSPDFRDQVIGRNVWPLLRRHDHVRFEIFCYSGVVKGDAITEQFKSFADGWRDIGRLEDQAAAEMIRADRIDILVDLSLHTPGNRLMLFARKPAPVQITFAGYPGGTGLAAMDWRLTDRFLDPVGVSDVDYVERSFRLADSFWCYDPAAMESADLPVGELPALKNGYVTFGCLNSFCKISERTMGVWKQVMQSAPGSRLVVLAPRGEVRARFLRTMERVAARVDFVSHQSRRAHLAEFGRIDLSLDTLPYNGHTTSLESMWMGVPVVSGVGRTVVGRAGVSQLSNLGLSELVAEGDEEFVRVAGGLAADVGRLTELRGTLRGRMAASALTDGRRFARNVESAYREIWTKYLQESQRGGGYFS